jgi:hypothetical protein
MASSPTEDVRRSFKRLSVDQYHSRLVARNKPEPPRGATMTLQKLFDRVVFLTATDTQ